MSKPADYAAREKALDIRHSFVVTAPAGSGKTGLLTQRMLSVLARADSPEQILCMTFTRKAAAEMRRRLIEALIIAQKDTEPVDDYERKTWLLAKEVLARDRALDWQLIAAPSRLRILTIDSFCSNLARQLAIESGFNKLPEPLENTDKYYLWAVQDLLGELESASALADELANLLVHFDNDVARLESLLVQMLSKREQWLPHLVVNQNNRELLEQACLNVIEETLTDAGLKLMEQAGCISELSAYAAQNLQKTSSKSPLINCLGMVELPDPTVDNVSTWVGIVELFLTKSGDWRKKIDVANGFPSGKKKGASAAAENYKKSWQSTIGWLQKQPGLKTIFSDIRSLPARRFTSDQWQTLQALTAVLPALSARLSWIFRRAGFCDYSEVTLAAHAALGAVDDPSDLMLRLDNQIYHILVDEFQDTSSVHFDILRRLTAGWQKDDGRTLFLVGDGMQSLYGFRNANVGLMLDLKKRPVGNVKFQALELSANFRSQKGIINWINRQFGEAFPFEENIGRGAVPYTPAESVKEATDEPAVVIDTFDDDPEHLLEAEHVARIATETRTKKPTACIAILVRNRTHLRQILPALRASNLPWRATAIEPLANCMPVIDLLSLTRALLNPADRVAWLSILRAPWCGLNLADLLHLATASIPANPIANGEQFPLLFLQILNHEYADPSLATSMTNDGYKILCRLSATLSKAWRQRYRKPLRIWLEGIWHELGGPETLRKSETMAQCNQYWDLLEQHARNGCIIPDWQNFEADVDALYAEPYSDPALNGDTNTSAIQIMTIHKAKGLEFDTVILPGLDRGTRNPEAELLLWRERVTRAGEAQLLMSAPQKTGAEKDQIYEHLKTEASIKTRMENTRVLYVACTRAINHLHILFQKPTDKPGINSLLATLWPGLKDELDSSRADYSVNHHRCAELESDIRLSATNTTLAAHQYQFRLPAHWQRPNISGEADEKHSTQPDSTIDVGAVSSPRTISNFKTAMEERDRQNLGILFHRTLKSLVEGGIKQWDRARIERQRLMWIRQVQELSINNQDTAIDTLVAALENCLSDRKHAWLFDNTLAGSACELVLGYSGIDGRDDWAVIDRTFLLNGERWIVDYKFSSSGVDLRGGNTDATPNLQHVAQLQHYADLFAKLEDVAVRTALYFPLTSQLQVIETRPGQDQI